MSVSVQIKHCCSTADLLKTACRALMGASPAFERREFARLRQGETA